MPNNKQKNRVIFPQNSSLIVEELLEKYNLQEDIQTAISKGQKGKASNGRILAELVKQAAAINMPVNKLASEIMTQLKSTKKQAEDIAKHLKTEIIEQVMYPSTQPTGTISALNKKNTIPRKRDGYREPVEVE